MADLEHTWGEDLNLTPTGGLSLSAGTDLGQQRVGRRLMTCNFDDAFHTDYGAGAPEMVGSVINVSRIQATFLTQMRLEESVDQTTPPTVTITSDSVTGQTNAVIRYVDADTGITYELDPLQIG